MASLGSYLKRERELRGISLDDIAEVTKISKKSLIALESDDFSSLPPPVFVKGFLRSYSNYIGLDTNDVILRYEDYLEKQKETNLPIERVEEKKNARFLPLLLILIAIILIPLIAYLAITPTPQSNMEKDKADRVMEGNTPSPEEIPHKEKITDKPTPTSPISTSGHSLFLKASEVTWIRVVIDGKDTREVLLQPGEKITWKAKEGFFVVIGNAGGVDVAFDGKLLEGLGESGEVVKLNLPIEQVR